MSIFRAHTPKRRNITRIVHSHGEHRDDLKLDYIDRCGYCNDIDILRFIWFEIDHFVPRKHLNNISETDYSNLVYSCRSCNNAKRAKWPTRDENIHNHNNIGFIDPCEDDYKNQFERLNTGRIKPKTDLGEYMYNEMKLYKPQHEIIWNLEQLDALILEVRELVTQLPDDFDLSKRLNNLYNTYYDYIQKLFKH